MSVATSAVENETVLIYGLGLIGGSIAKGLRAANPGQTILAIDSSELSIEQAVSEGVIDASGPAEELLARADIVILAVPPLRLVSLLTEIERFLKPSAVITDVGSVKSHIYDALQKLSPHIRKNFVLGHPIAGSEKSGYTAAQADLFSGRKVILTPSQDTSPQAIAAVNRLWRSLGANVIGMGVRKHDEVLAATSHLPHALAFAIVDVLTAQDESDDIFRYAAGGFADFSRLASSNPQMWSDIFVANSAATEKVLGNYIQRLTVLKNAIHNKDHDFLLEMFARSKETRDLFIQQHFNTNKLSTMTTKSVTFIAQPGGSVSGDLRVPGDKSISHRSIIFGAIANGVTSVSGFLEGEDALNTVAAFREMGVTIVGPENGNLTIFGVGKNGLQAPRGPLYMGNSGTAMRLLAGLLAAQSFSSQLTGDESLSGRPMNRVVKPLQQMGAQITAQEAGTPPLEIKGSQLKGIQYSMPMASAQVKSCLLLAGLYAEGKTTVSEPASCRDHTERMLKGFSYPVDVSENGTVSLDGGHDLTAMNIDVPGDISSAAFFLVAAAITPGADLTLRHVGVNPTRTGVINILVQMGAKLELSNETLVGGEAVADIHIQYSELHGIDIPESEIPLAIDEFPVLFVAAANAKGVTTLRGAQELRVKESDRIEAMAQGLTTLGVKNEVYPDGIQIEGGPYAGGEIESHGDHRIAMAFSVAALRASGTIRILNCNNVATSFPGFVELAASLGLNLAANE
ncbi:MAG: 3-phosphoshikimate 1-carboxyvinyltransferase [Pseudohongiellaceae bacterium]|jgi:3-phosphoshikimate 1-carboxyvinyltransferase